MICSPFGGTNFISPTVCIVKNGKRGGGNICPICCQNKRVTWGGVDKEVLFDCALFLLDIASIGYDGYSKPGFQSSDRGLCLGYFIKYRSGSISQIFLKILDLFGGLQTRYSNKSKSCSNAQFYNKSLNIEHINRGVVN